METAGKFHFLHLASDSFQLKVEEKGNLDTCLIKKPIPDWKPYYLLC